MKHPLPRLVLLAAGCALPAAGCATVMSEGTGNALHADAQRLMAGSVESGLAPFRELVAGKQIAVRIVGDRGRRGRDAPLLYARECLREMIAAEGGVYVGETGSDVRLEIFAARAGTRITERNLVANAGQYARIPIFYGEGFGGASEILVVARDASGNLLPRRAPRGEAGEMEYHLFRMIGPLRR